MAAVTTATRGDETKMAPWGPGWGWRLRSRGTRGWCYVLIAMEILTGFASATHHSGGSSVRVAKNPSSREPYEFSSDYVKKALKAPLRPKTKWPDLTPYYSNFTDQYAAYSKKVHAGQIKILKNPSKTKMTVCANLEILDANDNNSYMGVFKCPNAFEPVQNTYCCGNEYSQYCCEPSDDSLMSKILGPMIVVPLFLFVLFLWGWSCCCKKKDAKEDDEPMDTKATENQPEEVKVVNSRPPSKANDDQVSVVQSENQTSCTSLGSDGDNGYGSGPLAETKPLDPAYPPTNEKDIGGAERRTHAYQPSKTVADDRETPPRANKPKAINPDEVDELHLSEPSLYEDPML